MIKFNIHNYWDFKPIKSAYVPKDCEGDVLIDYRERLNKMGYELISFDELPDDLWGGITKLNFYPKKPQPHLDYYLVIKVIQDKNEKRLFYGDQFLNIPKTYS